MPTPCEALLVLRDTPVPPGPPPDTPVPPPDPDALRKAKIAYRDALRDANVADRETLREALRGQYSDGPLRRARRNAGLVGELLRLIRLDRTGAYWGAAQSSDERLTIPLALELLEIFVLASLYFRPARPDLTVAAPARLAGRTTSFDLFGLTARAHIAGHRGLEMRLRVIAALVMAPLRLTRAEIRKWANHGTHQERDAWSTEVHGLWGAELDRQEAELRGSLRDEMQAVKAHEASAEPPAVSSILPEALRRSEPSTYNTLRDLFWDHMNCPLAGGKEPGR